MPEHVLVAVDDSPQSFDALEYALDTHADATLTALHVVDPVEWLTASTPEAVGQVPTDLEEEAEAEAEQILSEVTETAAEYDTDVSTVTETGEPHRVILDYADDHDVDHVVMGSHGRSGLSRMLLGSVAETVVRRSAVPVTVIRS